MFCIRGIFGTKALAWLMLATYLALNLRMVAPLVHYQLERDYYLQRCENLSRPSMRCGGKCVLARRMQAELQQARHQADAVKPYGLAGVPAHCRLAVPLADLLPVSGHVVPPVPAGYAAVCAAQTEVPTPPPWA